MARHVSQRGGVLAGGQCCFETVGWKNLYAVTTRTGSRMATRQCARTGRMMLRNLQSAILTQSVRRLEDYRHASD